MENLKHYQAAIKNRIYTYINERKGYTTDRRIVVIESDDWGSIRMPSIDVFNKMVTLNLDVAGRCYNENDSLATKEDLSLLFDVLSNYKDCKGNSPKITANTCVANPDFEKIKASDFSSYFYEPFTTTLERYPHCSFDSWKEGIAEHLFVPQLHGREHLNAEKWICELQQRNPELRAAFELQTWGIRYNKLKESVVEEFIVNSDKSVELQKEALKEGMQLFKKIFGYVSKSFIAPCYTWNTELNETLEQIGVDILQGNYFQYLSKKGRITDTLYHYMGERNSLNQVYLIRNCLFEPTQNPQLNKDFCLKGIKKAFDLKKPAIISAHRLNFIGAIRPKNRDNNLRQFSDLLQMIVKYWPDVEFMSSNELGDFIKRL
ncbi:hypothetical protein [Bacteroides salyersiae]|jgi:hypothetical protein|uniref:hypothetical protein n=1 Tax=Bacteroides salyersiae TaxID=291644 RepID=UPI001C8CB71B|nr:hypothetical protein [Bacteroides salyersiae]